jgi:hypothetical protein
VLFEAGFAYGMDPDHTILVQVGSLRGLSDLRGLYIPRMKNTKKFRRHLHRRLTQAQCDVNQSAEWEPAVDLDAPARPLPTRCHGLGCHRGLRFLTGKWEHKFETPGGPQMHSETAAIEKDGTYRGNQEYHLDVLLYDHDEDVLALAKRKLDGSIHSVEVLKRAGRRLDGYNQRRCQTNYAKG